MIPRADLVLTGFYLAKPGSEYMLYLSCDATSAVSGLQAAKSYHCRRYDPEQDMVAAAVQFYR